MQIDYGEPLAFCTFELTSNMPRQEVGYLV